MENGRDHWIKKIIHARFIVIKQCNSNKYINFLPLKLSDLKFKYENVIHPNLDGLTIVFFCMVTTKI